MTEVLSAILVGQIYFLDVSAQQNMIFDIDVFCLFQNSTFISFFIIEIIYIYMNSIRNMHFVITKV